MTGKPSYGQWVYHLCRKWQPPKKHTLTRGGKEVTVNVDVTKLIGVAVMMASWGTDGSNIYPSAEKIAPHADMTPRQVKNLRQLAVSLGMFRVTGKRGRSQILEVAIPPDTVMVNHSSPSWCTTVHPTYVNPKSILSNSNGEPQFTIDTGSSATGLGEQSEPYEGSDGEESFTIDVQPPAPTPGADGWHHEGCDCGVCRTNRIAHADSPQFWQKSPRRCQCADCKSVASAD